MKNNFFKKLQEPKFVLIYFVMAILVIVIINLDFMNFDFKKMAFVDEDEPSHSIKVCTESAKQPSCFSDQNQYVELSWLCEDSKADKVNYNMVLQLAENADFEPIKLEIEEFGYSGISYRINIDQLDSGHEYYWRLKVQDDLGTWSGWAAHEETFILSPKCDN